jgi:hypothetical protein
MRALLIALMGRPVLVTPVPCYRLNLSPLQLIPQQNRTVVNFSQSLPVFPGDLFVPNSLPFPHIPPHRLTQFYRLTKKLYYRRVPPGAVLSHCDRRGAIAPTPQKGQYQAYASVGAERTIVFCSTFQALLIALISGSVLVTPVPAPQLNL